ncbi:putative 8-amino-7-oxononanoate synthase [alpha proteobacterium Q-1]|nr:putative 8-amino-7-oxononanoate synthase [alpha proteobacterium Q-1]
MIKPSSLAAFAEQKLDALRDAALDRHLHPTARGAGMTARRHGQDLISFSDNDYLGLSTDPRLIEAAVDATRRYGAGAGASRLVSGDHPLYARLEARLAAFKGTEDAVVFGSGYLANIGSVPVFVGREDLIVIDEWAHACLHSGARLAQSRCLRFPHNDMHSLDHLLATHRRDHRHALIITDGVFSMDGDQAPLAELTALAQKHQGWLMVDDAHGVGVLGKGRGTPAQQNQQPDLLIGTLSKALGSYGGYVAADRPVIELIRNRARSLIYTTGLPPAAIGAALAALDIMENDPDLCAKPLMAAQYFCQALGLPEPQSAVVPLILGSAEKALAAQAKLLARGYLVVAIRPPTVPDGTARLRFSFSASHRQRDIDGLIAALQDTGIIS